MKQEKKTLLTDNANVYSKFHLASAKRQFNRRMSHVIYKLTSLLFFLSVCVNVYLIFDQNDNFLSSYVLESATNLTARLPVPVQLNQTETFAQAEKESNVAATFWEKWQNIKDNENEQLLKENVTYCKDVILTHPLEVSYSHSDWQQFQRQPENNNKTGCNERLVPMYLYNAYYDKRAENAPVVKLIGANSDDTLMRSKKWWCLLWFDNLKPAVLVQVSEYYTPAGYTSGLYHTVLISCPIPSQYRNQVPRAVSLQSQGRCKFVEQKPSTVLRVIYNERNDSQQSANQSRIGICVAAFRFASYDFSIRLVEWLQMVKLMRADKVFFYVYGAPENMMKVLRHYEKEKFVDWRLLTLPGNQPNVRSLYNMWAFKLNYNFWPIELLELHDCFYKNLYQFDYIAIIDVDELIISKKAADWPKLIESNENSMSTDQRQSTGYQCFHASYQCQVYETQLHNGKPIPEYLYMMRHIQRSKPKPSSTHKCFQRTDIVSSVHNHSPLACLDKKTGKYIDCNGFWANTDDAVLLHFRRNSSSNSPANWQCPIHDQTIWRYYEQLKDTVRENLEVIF